MTDRSDFDVAADLATKQLGLSLVKEIGRGAFKVVYLVSDPSGTHLALKICAGANERSEREILALRACDHSNIARLYQVGTANFNNKTYQYFLEEYLQGGTLGQRLRDKGLLSKSDCQSLGLALIDAIDHLAERAIVHRDLKPENIMFRDDKNDPVIVDFNIVRLLSASSLTVTWIDRGPGTPLFAAPEQLNNDKRLIDWRTDQFSLGVVLSTCCLGMHPFDGAESDEDAMKIIERIASRRGPSARFQRAAAAGGLECLVKMVQTWPVMRYRTVDLLRTDWLKQGR